MDFEILGAFVVALFVLALFSDLAKLR